MASTRLDHEVAVQFFLNPVVRLHKDCQSVMQFLP